MSADNAPSVWRDIATQLDLSAEALRWLDVGSVAPLAGRLDEMARLVRVPDLVYREGLRDDLARALADVTHLHDVIGGVLTSITVAERLRVAEARSRDRFGEGTLGR